MPVAILNNGTFNAATSQWATGSTTGYENSPGYAGSLTDGSAITVQSNTTYSHYLNLGASLIGTQPNPVTNVTFIGCCWSVTGANTVAAQLYGSNFSFQYCTFQPGPFASFPPSVKDSPVPQANGYQWCVLADGTQANPGTFNTFAAGVTLDHCDCWGFSNAISLVTGGTQAQPYVLTNNYIHNHRLNTNGLDHQDGFGSPGNPPGSTDYLQFGPGNSVVEDYTRADTNAIVLTGGVNCTYTGNLFGGYGNTIFWHGTSTNLTFTDNTFTTAVNCAFSPLYDESQLTTPGFTWRRNKWLVPAGAPWGHPAYNGYYWMPVAVDFNLNDQGADELALGLVSVTDYTG